MENNEEEKCFICDNVLNRGEASKNLTCKRVAISRLRSSSLKRKDKKYVFLKDRDSVDLHKSCYIDYINETLISAAKEGSPSTFRRQSTEAEAEKFDFSGNCFFCGSPADDAYIERNAKHGTAYKNVQFVNEENTIINMKRFANENNDWDYMKTIDDRIKNVDLIAVGGRYHHNCMVLFDNYDSQSSHVTGRPISDATVDIVDFISNYIIENSEECQFSLKDLIEKYQNSHDNVIKPKIQNIKDRLLQFFGDEIRILPKKSDYNLIFVDSVNDELRKTLSTCQNQEEEEERIITSAGHIILKKIRSQEYDLENYPAPSKFLDDLDKQTPPLLQKLLNIIICTHKKPSNRNIAMWNHRVTMFSHAIVASARPRGFISPLLLGVSTLLHKKHATRNMIDSLSHLGVAESYSETLKFEESMSRHREKLSLDGTYIQMIFDNTMNGRNTFGATGGIMCVTPASSVVTNEQVKRSSTKSPPISGEFGFLPVLPFIKPKKSRLNSIILEKINTCRESFMIDVSVKDFLWSYNKSFNFEKCPGWNGFMEKCAQEKPYEISKVIPTPFVNAPISNYDTIFTILREANIRCKANNQNHIVVTFDLPPYQKAIEVLACVKGTPLEEQVNCVILRVGGLRVAMAFGCSIGFIMQGSGLEEAFSQLYVESSVEKALSGNAWARMFRGHSLVECALNKIVIELMNLKTAEITILSKILSTAGTGDFHEIVEETEFRNIYNRFKDQLNAIEAFGPTAKLWVQYIRMVEILKLFIEAERTGDWHLHLNSLRLMLPYLHAAGHTAYAKYSQLYLQQMTELEKNMDIFEFDKLTNRGYFTVRRTDKFRTGIASDTTIEQMLMRPMKSPEGLTDCRGLSGSVISRWVLSSITLVNIVDLIENYCNVEYQTSEQHVDSSNASTCKDNSDLKKLSSFFDKHNPFPQTDNIISITTGVIGNDTINCHKAFENGYEAMNKMEGQFGSIKMSRKNVVIPLKAATSFVKIEDDVITVDENLIYHRMIINIQIDDERKKYLNYELAPYPMSLFKDGIMRKPNKADFYDLFNKSPTVPVVNITYIIDGRLLLNTFVWQNMTNVGDIINGYVNYVSKLKCIKIVVFKSYSSDAHSSTKEYERLRRQNKNLCCDILIDSNTNLTVKQEKFLSNKKNKEQLITLICQEFEKNKIETVIVKEDSFAMIFASK